MIYSSAHFFLQKSFYGLLRLTLFLKRAMISKREYYCKCLTDYYILEIYCDLIKYAHAELNNTNSITRNVKSHAIQYANPNDIYRGTWLITALL